jgi:hypothetical protein
MSYTEYLRRKAAGSPVVIDRRTNTDASMYTMRQRHLASSIFFTSNRVGAINNTFDVSTNPQKAVRSYVKDTGRVPDASTFTSYSATWQLPLVEGKVTLNPCCVPTLGPAPKSASDFTREAANCCVEPHIANELGPALFVDNTIRLKHLVGCCENEISKAIHTHPEPTPFASWSARPEKGAGGIPVFTVSSPDDARKVGDFNPRKIPYVEKHHGNDLKVNPRRPITQFVPNTGIPHLKINDAFPRGCEGCGLSSQVIPVQCDGCESGPTAYDPIVLTSIAEDEFSVITPQDYTPCIGDTFTITYTVGNETRTDFTFDANDLFSLEIKKNGVVTDTIDDIVNILYTIDNLVVGHQYVFTITVNTCGTNSISVKYDFDPPDQ